MTIPLSTNQFLRCVFSLASLCFTVASTQRLKAQTTETFESITASGTSRPTTFTSNSQPFTLTSSNCNSGNIFGVFVPSFRWTPCDGGLNRTDVATAPYGVGTSCTGGTCTGTSNKFIDNGGLNAAGAITYSIKTSNAVLFTVKSLFIFLSVDGANPSDAGGLTVRGKKGGTTKFTYTKTTGFNTGFAANNGFTYIDFSAGTDFTLYNIDELEIQGGSTMKYMAIDNFRWGAKAAAIVTSAAASGIGSRGARLNGNVNDNAASTTTSFEYSTNATLSSGVNSIAATPGTITQDAGATAISANLTGLTPTTTYYYRAKGVNANGTTTGAILSFTTTISLPVKLISFAAQVKTSTIQLDWTVADEKQLQGYEVERSMDGKIFQTIKTIQANEQTAYSAEDHTPRKGNNFYRLKINDNDGTVNYSPVVKAAFNAPEQMITLASNPVEHGIITVHTNIPQAGSLLFILTDMSGRAVLSEKMKNPKNQIRIPVNDRLQPGSYILSVSDDKELLSTQHLIIK